MDVSPGTTSGPCRRAKKSNSRAAGRVVWCEADSTTVRWSGDLVAVTGLLKMVPKGLMEGAAKKVIDDVWAAVGQKLTAG